MHQKINQIKRNEGSILIIKNFLTQNQIKKIQNLHKVLPVEIDNKRQKIVKKKWAIPFFPKLQKILIKKN